MIGEARLPAGFPAPGPVDQVLVKHYPAYRAAKVEASAMGNGDENRMFMPLFNHIRNADIPMTSPVEMEYATAENPPAKQHALSMAFVYPDPAIGRPGTDGVVQVADMPEMTVLSIGVRGSYSDEHFRRALEKLMLWLQENSGRYQIAGPPRYLAYNSPFVPWFLKFGEVQIPVNAAP